MQKSSLRRLGAVLAGAAILVAACSDDKKSDSTTATTAAPVTTMASGSTTPSTDAGVTCDGVKLAFMGALSGDNGALGTNMINGAQIAIDEFNAANPNCQVEFDTSYDSQGDPAQATPLADQIVNDSAIIGLIGPGFSGETKATMPKFEEAGLPMITPGATNALLSTNGWTMFHRILANDDKQAPGVVKLIKDTIGATKVGVIDDASEYGKGLADSVRSGLGDKKVADDTIDPKASDFSAAVNKMKGAGVDTVFYGGYYAEAAKLVQQMRDAGLTATFVSGDGSLDKAFVDNAGPAAEGAYLTATGAPADVNADFQAAFNAKYGTDPALYSPEAYDCAKVFLAGIAAGNVTRADLAAFVSAYDAPGITKQIKFDATGEPLGDAVYYYVVESGKIVAKGLI
jgi:branched-chain amino acid transport system substrate-binding protein